MKKPFFWVGLGLLAVAIGLVLWLIPSGQADRSAANARLEQAAKSLNSYWVDATLKPEENVLTVTEKITFVNSTADTLSSLTLRTYAGAYQTEEFSPAATQELYDACYGDAFSAGDIALYGAWWNGALVTPTFLDEARTVLNVPVEALAPGDSGELTLRFSLTIPACAHRFGVSQDVYRFGNVLPTLAVYENGAWRTDEYSPIGDPFYSECANWTFRLSLPDGYTPVASCALVRQENAWVGTLSAARDFAFAVSRDYVLEKSTAQGVDLLVAAKDKAGAKRALKALSRAMNVYTALYGDYPYETLSLCAVAFPFGGMEYPGLIFLSEDDFSSDKETSMELLIAHETAHQWFYALVGSDQFNQPWQDEALCEWAMLRYALKTYGQGSMETLKRYRVDEPMKERIASSVTPASPIDYFADMTEYQAVVYGRGAALLCAVDEMLGGRLDDFLKAYCEQYAFLIASRQDFEASLNAFSGMDLSPLLLDYLDTYISN